MAPPSTSSNHSEFGKGKIGDGVSNLTRNSVRGQTHAMARRQYQSKVGRIQYFGDSMRGNRDHVQRSVKGRPGIHTYIKLCMSPTEEVRNPFPVLAELHRHSKICLARRPQTVYIFVRLVKSPSLPVAIYNDTPASTLARRSTNAHSLVAKPDVLVRITCSNSECHHIRYPTSPAIAICSLLLFSYRIHLSPGSRRSGNSLLNQSRISAQSRKTVVSSSTVPPAPQPTPPVVPFTVIDGPPVIQIPPATPSDQSLSPPNTPPPLVPVDPQIALQHLQRQHNSCGNLSTNADVRIHVPTWQPVDPGFPARPLSSSSLSSSDSPSELINTPANFPSELGGYPNQICIATDDQLTQPGGVHDSWLLGNNSYAAFADGFSKEVTTLSPTSTTDFVNFPHRFSDVYEAPSTMPSHFYPTPLPTPAQFFPQQLQEPETPAQHYMRTFKSHVSSPHNTFAGYADCYVNQIHTRSNSLPNLPFQGNSPPGIAPAWNHVRNDFASTTNWTCANQQRSWA